MMGYEAVLSDVEEKKTGVKEYQSGVKQKQVQVKRVQQQIDTCMKQLKQQRYQTSIDRGRQLYAKKELESLKNKRSQLKTDLKKLIEAEKEAGEALDQISSQESTIKDYQQQGYEVKETDEGYKFFKEEKVGGRKVSRSLSKTDWMDVKDWRPDSLKNKMSESAFEDALWQIYKGKDSVTKNNVMLYRTKEGKIGFSEGYKVDYVGVNPAYTSVRDQIDMFSSMIKGFDDLDRVKTPAYSRIQRGITSTLGDIREVLGGGLEPSEVVTFRNLMLKLGRQRRKLSQTQKYTTVKYTPQERVMKRFLSGRITYLNRRLENIPRTKEMTKTVFPREGQSLSSLLSSSAVMVKNPEYKEFTVLDKLPVRSERFNQISNLIESRVNKGVSEKIPLVTGWSNLVSEKKVDTKKSVVSSEGKPSIEDIPKPSLDLSDVRSKNIPAFEVVTDNTLSHLSQIQFLSSSYAGMTAAPEYLPGSTEYKMKQFQETGTTGSLEQLISTPGEQRSEGLTLTELKPDIQRSMGILSGLSGGVGPGVETIREKKQYFILTLDSGKPLYLKETKPSLYYDYSPSSDAGIVKEELLESKKKIDTGISTIQSNIIQIHSYLDMLDSTSEKKVLYDIDNDNEMESVSKDRAVKDLHSELKSQKESLKEFQSSRRMVEDQLKGIGTLTRIGYGVRKNRSGGWSILRPDTEKVYSLVTGDDEVSIADQIIFGDFGIESAFAWGATQVTGDKRYWRTTQRDIMSKRLGAEYNVKRTEMAGGSGSFAYVMNLAGSPAGQTVGLTIGTFGTGFIAGAIVKSGSIALKGTKIGGKVFKVGKKIGKYSLKVGKYTVTPGKIAVYSGVAALEAANISRIIDEQGFKAPGKLGTHFLRFGLGWKSFEYGMKAGYGKPISSTSKDVRITDLRTESRLRDVKASLKRTQEYMWGKHPRVTGNLRAVSGRIGDYGRQAIYTVKSGSKQIIRSGKSGYVYLKGKSNVLSTLDEGIRADIQTLRSSSKIKGFKNVFVKKSSGVRIEFPDDDLAMWRTLDKKQGKFRGLNRQLVQSDDTQILVEQLVKGKGLEPDVFRFRFKSNLSVTDDFASGMKISRDLKTTGQGLTLVEKEPIVFRDPFGKVRMVFRPSGRTASSGVSAVSTPRMGRFVKESNVKFIDFLASSKKLNTPGLAVVDDTNQYFEFLTATKAKMRSTGSVTRSLGYGKYNPSDEAFATIDFSPMNYGYVMNKKGLTLQLKQVDLDKTFSVLKKGQGGKISVVGKYSPPEGIDEAMYNIKGSMVTVTPQSPTVMHYSISNVESYNPKSFIQNVEASASLGFQQQKVQDSIGRSVLAGIGDVAGQAVSVKSISPSVPVVDFSALVLKSGSSQVSSVFSGVGSSYVFDVDQKEKRDIVVRRRLQPEGFSVLQRRLQGKESERVVEPVFDAVFRFDLGQDVSRRPAKVSIMDLQEVQLQKQQLKLKMDLKLDLDIDTPSPVEPVMPPGFKSPSPPMPPGYPKGDGLDLRQSRRKSRIRFSMKPKRKPLKPLTRKKVLANPFRVMQSQQRFGRATHPQVKGDVVEFGRKLGWDIPTMELLNVKKEKKKKSKRKVGLKLGLGKSDWSLKV